MTKKKTLENLIQLGHEVQNSENVQVKMLKKNEISKTGTLVFEQSSLMGLRMKIVVVAETEDHLIIAIVGYPEKTQIIPKKREDIEKEKHRQSSAYKATNTKK